MALDAADLRSRRALLAGTVAGLAALAAQALGRPTPTQASHAGPVQLGHSNTATDGTFIKNTTAGGQAFGSLATGGGTAIGGSSLGWGDGVRGGSNSGNGVWGGSTVGTGVKGQSFGAGGTSIYGLKLNTGAAVWGEIQDTTSDSGAVVGRSYGSGPGVVGESTLGRGGRFAGKKAQIRPEPSTAATHPSSGTAGDIFLDASKRLWLCKGGTTWALIA